MKEINDQIFSSLEALEQYRAENGQSTQFIFILKSLFCEPVILGPGILPDQFIKLYKDLASPDGPATKTRTLITLSEYDVRKVLKEIAEKTFPDRPLQFFKISILSKESASYHGDYNEMSREIRIYNLSRRTSDIIKTTIHELAHHCDNCFNGDSPHKKRFYGIYKQLLEKAHALGHIDLAKVIDEIDTRDIRMLEKHCGPLRYEPRPKEEDAFVCKVFNSYEYKNILRDRGYVYSPTEKAWVKEFTSEELATEGVFLADNMPAARVESVSSDEHEIESVYYLIIGSKNQSISERMKADGFFFHDKFGWVKRIHAADKKREEDYIKEKYHVKPMVVGKL